MGGGVSWREVSWLGAEGTLLGQDSWCSPPRSPAHDTQAGPRAPCPPTPTDPSAKMPACAPHPALHHCSPIPCHFLWTSQLPALCWMGWWGSEPSSESGVLARPLASHPPSIGASCHARLTGLLLIRPHSPTPCTKVWSRGAGPGVCWGLGGKQPHIPATYPGWGGRRSGALRTLVSLPWEAGSGGQASQTHLGPTFPEQHPGTRAGSWSLPNPSSHDPRPAGSGKRSPSGG